MLEVIPKSIGGCILWKMTELCTVVCGCFMCKNEGRFSIGFSSWRGIAGWQVIDINADKSNYFVGSFFLGFSHLKLSDSLFGRVEEVFDAPVHCCRTSVHLSKTQIQMHTLSSCLATSPHLLGGGCIRCSSLIPELQGGCLCCGRILKDFNCLLLQK